MSEQKTKLLLDIQSRLIRLQVQGGIDGAAGNHNQVASDYG